MSYLLKRVLRSKRGNSYWGSGDLRGFTIVDLNDHAAFEAIWRLSRNETHSLCPQYIDFIYTFSLSSPFCTRNPPAQLKQFSMFCFDLILRGKFKRSKIALLLALAVLFCGLFSDKQTILRGSSFYIALRRKMLCSVFHEWNKIHNSTFRVKISV